MYNNERIKQFYYYDICIYVCILNYFSFSVKTHPKCEKWLFK